MPMVEKYGNTDYHLEEQGAQMFSEFESEIPERFMRHVLARSMLIIVLLKLQVQLTSFKPSDGQSQHGMKLRNCFAKCGTTQQLATLWKCLIATWIRKNTLILILKHVFRSLKLIQIKWTGARHREKLVFFFFFFLSIWLDVPHLTNEHRTQDCIDEGNSAYCQSSGAHNIKHI